MEFRLRHVRVLVSPSHIEDVASHPGFDAVVSSDDTSLGMSGGVSRAIRLAAGETVQEEVRRLVPVRVGDVVVTSAGRLPVRYVFHAITMDFEKQIRPTDWTMRSIGRSIFARSEDLGVKKIAIPAVGTGAAGFSAKMSAQLIIESLAEHANQPTNLQEVVFCLPDEDVRGALLSELRAALVAPVDGPPSELQWPSVRRLRQPLVRNEPEDLHLEAPSARGFDRDRSARSAGSPSQSSIRTRLSKLLRRDPEHGGSRLPKPRRARHDPGHPVLGWTDADTRPSDVLARRDVPSSSRDNRPLLNDRYVLLEEIGRGGMGIVYLAWDLVIRQTVAIKTLRPADGVTASQSERLRREAAHLMRLTHAGIVRVFQFEPRGGPVGPYLIMEYVPWVTGDRWLAETGTAGLPARAVFRVGERLCEALANAHDAGVLHLDVKPSNVFIDPAAEHPKLADFGIATSMGPDSNALVTRLLGTPAYMAPEQRELGGQIGTWTDVYLLAGTLWELVTGSKPSGDTGYSHDPTLAAPLAVLRRGLATSFNDRPRNTKEFAGLLATAFAHTT